MLPLNSIDSPTPPRRIEEMKQRFLNHESHMCCQRAQIYTEVYKRDVNLPVIIKRANALKETLERIDIFIEKGELIVGHPASRPRSAEVFPEMSFHWMTEIDEFETREYNRLKVSDEVKQILRDIYPFWEGNTPTERFQALRSEETKRCFSAGLLSNPHEYSTFAHVGLDYGKILTKGITGIFAEIEHAKQTMDFADPGYHDRSIFYMSLETICTGVISYASRYKKLVEHQAKVEKDPLRYTELINMSQVLDRVPLNPAQTFHEALQSFWFVQLIAQIEGNGFSISPGRFDQYMYPYLKHDLEEGLSLDEALEYLECLWLKFAEILRVDNKKAAEVNAGYASGQNLVIGGMDRHGKDMTNLMSHLCLIANKHVGLHQPNFTVRLHKNTPEDFLEEVVASIGNGNGMPQILNDEVIIPSLTQKGCSLFESRDYIPVGCDEITVPHMWARCNGGYLNFPKILEFTLNEGKDMTDSIPFGNTRPLSSFRTFDDLYHDVLDRMRRAIKLQVSEANLTDLIHREMMPLPFVSIFVDDCIASGKDVTAGGARYNNTGLVGVGSANIGDSLYAIKSIVYDDKFLTLEEFRQVLVNDFESNELLRQRILNKLPKFGNDVDDVDIFVVEIANTYFDELEKYRNSLGGVLYPALYSVTAQVGLGAATAATPDGRKKGMPLADGLTPMYGQDISGPTAALKSIVKIDLVRAPNGVIVNQRLTAGLLSSVSGREKMRKLIRSFVDIGGFHWQFNIVDNKDLLDAQAHPEKYKGLVVRVAGYSAIFVELSKKAQDSVIARNAAAL